MKIAHLVPDRTKRWRKTGQRQAYFVNRWRVVSPSGFDLVQPFCATKTEARTAAVRLGLVLFQVGFGAEQLRALWGLRDHYGVRWKAWLRLIWYGGAVPADLRHWVQVYLQLRTFFGYSKLDRFKLPERFEINE